jgi:ubiquinone biosynthesis protein
LTGRRVITLDYLDGIKLSEPERLRQAGVDLPAAVRLTVEIYLTQIFDQGFYQADPHPANIMVMANGGVATIGLVDFGTAGYLLPRQKDLLGTMFLQLLDQDAAGLARTVLKMGAARGRPSLEAMERDLQRLLVHYWGVSLEQISFGEMLAEIFQVAYEHRVYLPGDLTLLGKTILTIEGTARALDPEFVLADAVRPFAEQLVRERLSPLAAGRQALRAVRQAADLAQAFPRRLDDLWDQLEEGEFTVGIDVRHLNLLISRLNSMVNRLAFAVVVAALIVGSALILHGGKDRWQLPILGVGVPVAQIVFLVAFGAAVWLIISMIRSRGV